jgi:hypothetical protein
MAVTPLRLFYYYISLLVANQQNNSEYSQMQTPLLLSHRGKKPGNTVICKDNADRQAFSGWSIRE